MKTYIYVRAGQSKDSRLSIDDQRKRIREYLKRLDAKREWEEKPC